HPYHQCDDCGGQSSSGKRSSSYLAQLRDVSARGDAVKNGRTLPEQDSGLPALVSDPGLPRMISTVL
ncbi:hypothetical protein AJR19_008485, partial [Shigella dysenteriae]